MGQAYLRLHIALNTAWTKYAAMADDRLQDREQVMQKVMRQVKAHRDRDGRRPKQISAAVDEIKGDSEEVQTLRKALTDVVSICPALFSSEYDLCLQVWTAASQMRNDLKKRAKQVVEEAYDMSTLQPKRKEALAAWLTRSYKQPLRGGALVSVPYFIFGDVKIAWSGEGRKAALDEKVRAHLTSDTVCWLNRRSGVLGQPEEAVPAPCHLAASARLLVQWIRKLGAQGAAGPVQPGPQQSRCPGLQRCTCHGY